jgi:hypothetical protein
MESSMTTDEGAFEAARAAWLESASDYTRLDDSIRAAILAYESAKQKEAASPAAPGMPSEQSIARWLCKSEGHTPDQVEALWTEWLPEARELIAMFAPAFEAKEREIEALKAVNRAFAGGLKDQPPLTGHIGVVR